MTETPGGKGSWSPSKGGSISSQQSEGEARVGVGGKDLLYFQITSFILKIILPNKRRQSQI